MNPTMSVDVDLSNPGQVFACCGLLELAHRLTPRDNRAMGWFANIDEIQTEFHIKAYDKDSEAISLPSIMTSLKECQITELEYNNKEGPVLIGEPFNFIVDWRKVYPQNNSVKTWAGQQDIFGIIINLQKNIMKNSSSNLLSYSSAFQEKFTKFDPSNIGTSIDIGFSFNAIKSKLKLRYSSYIITELLSLIGLQGFCPQKKERRVREFYVWNNPLPAPIARSVISNKMIGVSSKGFIFEMYIQGSEKNSQLKSFTYAKQISKGGYSDE